MNKPNIVEALGNIMYMTLYDMINLNNNEIKSVKYNNMLFAFKI